MFPFNAQFTNSSKALNHVPPNESSPIARNQVPNGAPDYEEYLQTNSKKLQDELQKFGSIIKEHEDNLKILKAQRSQLHDHDSIVDLQVRLGKYQSPSSIKTENDEHSHAQRDKDTIDQIMNHDKSAAGILCQLQTLQAFQNSCLKLTEDVIGIVATLGQVDDDKISRLLSEYLGLDTMLAIVCKSYDGVQALESYDNEGHVDKFSGIHGLGASLGIALQGRFRVICLENLRSYAGDFVADDPQRRLDITKPKLPSGEIPAGFVGFAVNLIKVNRNHLYCPTASRCGIRETLFYNLFSRLQVYRTRSDMLLALPCISDGAISLDGGMIRSNGVFSLGSREDVNVQFPKAFPAFYVPVEYLEIKKQMKQQEWERARLEGDIRREQAMLEQAKVNFQKKQQEYVKFLAETSKYTSQGHAHLYGRTEFCPFSPKKSSDRVNQSFEAPARSSVVKVGDPDLNNN